MSGWLVIGLVVAALVARVLWLLTDDVEGLYAELEALPSKAARRAGEE